MAIIVTGGAGFIGSHFITYILDHYPQLDVYCIDKLTYAGNLDRLEMAQKNPHFHFYQTDICDGQKVERIVAESQPELVINFAAESHVDRSIEDASPFIRTNIEGTRVLMEVCRKYGNIHFHQVSTDEVYGDLPLDEDTPGFNEESPLKPSSPYAASKASADLLVMAYHRTYNLPVTISRCSNNYGPSQDIEKLIPKTITHALKDEPVPLYGDGKNKRDWIYVDDHVRAIDCILQKGKNGEIYNIGTGEEISNEELVREIILRLGKDPNHLMTYVPDRLGHDRRYALNTTKIQTQLSWYPQIPLRDGLQRTIKSYGFRF